MSKKTAAPASPAPTSAPAAPSSPAPVSAPSGVPSSGPPSTPASSSSAGVDTPVPSATPEAPVAQPPEAAPYDSFQWDEWDGDSLDPFPDDVKPWLERANGKYKSRYDTLREEAEYEKKLYESLRDGQEDPRVSEYGGKVKELETWQQNAVKNLEELVGHHKKLQEEHEAFKEAQRADREKAYRESNQWIFDGGKVQQAASELFTENFTLDIIPELLKANPAVLERTRAFHKELLEAGTKKELAGKHALALARAEFQPPPPSPAATMISGASAPSQGTTQTGRLATDASLRDTIKDVVRRVEGKR